MGGYELHDHRREHIFRPVGGYFANFSSSVGNISEAIYSQQAVYLSLYLTWELLVYSGMIGGQRPMKCVRQPSGCSRYAIHPSWLSGSKRMEAGDALASTIEASIALAGFSGIVVVLGRRNQGEWRPQEELRLGNLLVNGFTAFFSSLLGILLLSTSLSAETTWRVCSLAWFVVVAAHSCWILIRSRKLGDDDLRKSSPFFFWFLSAVSASALLLQLANVVSLHQFWPFFVGIVTCLFLGARQFVVLVMPRG